MASRVDFPQWTEERPDGLPSVEEAVDPAQLPQAVAERGLAAHPSMMSGWGRRAVAPSGGKKHFPVDIGLALGFELSAVGGRRVVVAVARERGPDFAAVRPQTKLLWGKRWTMFHISLLVKKDETPVSASSGQAAGNPKASGSRGRRGCA